MCIKFLLLFYRRLVEWQYGYSHLHKVLSVEKKVHVIIEKEKWEGVGERNEADACGIWSRKFYNPNDLEKQNHNY
jgi:hypothetical protein